MGRSMVPGVPDRTLAAVHSDAGSVPRVLQGLAPAGMGEQERRHVPTKAPRGISSASIQAKWQWSICQQRHSR